MLDLDAVLPATRTDEDEHSPILPPQPPHFCFLSE